MTTLAPTPTTTNNLQPEPVKAKKSGSSKSKDPKKCSWRDNYANSSLSGVEFKDMDSGEVIHFTAIQHKELHKEPGSAFRVTVIVDQDRKPVSIPRKQTFEEMIQVKRRQQNLLYASTHSNTSSTVLSDRAARRVSAAARRRATNAAAAAAAAAVHAPVPRPSSRRPLNPEVVPSHRPRESQLGEMGTSTSNITSNNKSRSRSSSSRSKRKRPSRPSSSRRQPTATTSPVKLEPSAQDGPSTSAQAPPPIAPITVTTSPSVLKIGPSNTPIISNTRDLHLKLPLIDEKIGPLHMISSMKELSRQNPYLGPLDKKEIKRLLKSAPPGAALVLSNGTVIKKSRRGGARAGAGRKRNRPAGCSPSSAATNKNGAQYKDSAQPRESHSNFRVIQSIVVQPHPNLGPDQSSQAVNNNSTDTPTTSATTIP